VTEAININGAPSVVHTDQTPRRFRVVMPEGKRWVNGVLTPYRYGCYFPHTNVVVLDSGFVRAGRPVSSDNFVVEWID